MTERSQEQVVAKPIDLAKMDSIDDDATDKMIAYYWWQQAQDARAVLADMREALLAARNQLVVYHRTQFPEGTPLPQVIEGIDAALSRSERKGGE